MQPQDLITALTACGVTTIAQFQAIVQMAVLQMNLNSTNIAIAALQATRVSQTNAINTQQQTLQAKATTLENLIAALPSITITPPSS